MDKNVIIFSNSCWNIYNFRLPIIKKLSNSGYRITCVCAPDDHKMDLNKFVDNIIDVKIKSNRIDIISDIIYFLSFIKILFNMKPVIVLSFTIKYNIYIGIISRLININFFPTISGLGSVFISKSKTFRTITILLYRVALKRASNVFFHNKTDMRYFINKRICDKDNSSVVNGSGVDLEFFKNTDQSGNKDTQVLRFYYVGRIIKDKGIVEFLESANHIIKLHKNIEFFILGTLKSNNPSFLSETEFNTLLVPKKITYLGESKNVAQHLKNADFVVLPSYREGLSKALLEAAAMSIPLIASDVPGCREIVLSNITGFLCTPRSTNSLIKCIEKAIFLKIEARQKMGINARAHIETHFSTESVAAEYLEKFLLKIT